MKILNNPLFKKLLGIQDTPNRIALGFGLGLFLGVLPGTGAIAALVCAAFLRVNKPASLAGALLVNTWINIVAFPAALVIGAIGFGIHVQTLKNQWATLLSHFSWAALFTSVVFKSIAAVFFGYVVLGIIMAIIGYCIVYFVVKALRNRT